MDVNIWLEMLIAARRTIDIIWIVVRMAIDIIMIVVRRAIGVIGILVLATRRDNQKCE